jgi:hypothetical protein
MKLNIAQGIILVFMAIAFGLVIFFAPWELVVDGNKISMEHSLIWKRPATLYSVRTDIILIEMIAIAVIGAIALVITSSMGSRKFCFLIISFFVLFLLALHNPFGGYNFTYTVTKEGLESYYGNFAIMIENLTFEDYCKIYDVRKLNFKDFLNWESKTAFLPWIDEIGELVGFECLVLILGFIWMVILRDTKKMNNITEKQ